MHIAQIIEEIAFFIGIVFVSSVVGITIAKWFETHSPDDVKDYLQDKLEPFNRGWLHRDWWAYIFAPIKECDGLEHRCRTYVCRWKGHPYNIAWSGINEPVMTCANCYDDLT